jgi:hypothetical protein
LQHISQILQLPVTFFFEGTPGQSKEKDDALSPAYVTDFLATGRLRGLRAFMIAPPLHFGTYVCFAP